MDFAIAFFHGLNSSSLSGCLRFGRVIEFDDGEQMKIFGFEHLREFRTVRCTDVGETHGQKFVFE
jgi:hypothetical protein